MKKIILFALILISVHVFAQSDDTTKYLKYPGTYGLQYQRLWATRVLRPPLDTVYTKTGLATMGSTLYVGNGTYWTAISGSTYTGSNGVELNGSDFRLGNVSPTGSALTRDAYIYGNSLYGLRLNNIRFAQDTGTRVTAANSLTLGKDGNIFYISDTTRIKGIDTIGWQAGAIVHLFFLNYTKIMDSVTTGAGMAKVYLDGNEDSVTFQPGDYLGLMYNGGVWNEIGRKSRKSLSGYNIYNKDSTFTSNRFASLNGYSFAIGQSNANFMINPVTKQYFFGNQYSQIYSYLNMHDSTAVLNAGNNILESHVTLTLDALNNQAEIDVNGTGGFKHQTTGRVTTIGDVQNTGNKTKIIVDDVNSKVKITNMPSGASTDSMVVWDPGDSTLKKRPIPTGGFTTADNGLTASTSTNVQLFGTVNTPATLLNNRYLNATASFDLNITGSKTSSDGVFNVINTGSQGVAISGTANTGAIAKGVYGKSSSGVGVWGSGTSGAIGGLFNSDNGVALNAQSTGLSLELIANPATTNVSHRMQQFRRLTSGTAANGIGANIEFNVETDNGSERTAGTISVTWPTAADATRTSKFIITGVTSATTQDWLTIGQSGYVQYRPMTVTEAGALTPANGMIIYVSNTDATFLTVGFWGYQGGLWVKM